MCDVTKCPNPLCDASFVRTAAGAWFREGRKCVDCPECGVDLESLFQAVAVYRVAREAFTIAADAADAAWMRWFEKTRSGTKTNGAQASRLANEASYLSADLASAEGKVWSHEVDPRDVCVADGVDPAKFPATA